MATVAAVMLSVVSAASANRFSVDDQDFRIQWAPVTITAVGLSEISCNFTLSGSFHSPTISKVASSLIGHITHASVGTSDCEGGSASVLTASLPWHIVYTSFSGTLPNIADIDTGVSGMSMAVATEVATCLFRTSALNWPLFEWVMIFPPIYVLKFSPRTPIDTNDTTGSLCDLFGVNAELAGTGAVEDLSGAGVNARLI